MLPPPIQDWLIANQALIAWLASLSALAFVATLLAVPIIVARLPTDYFARSDHHRQTASTRHPLLHLIFVGCKNVFGAILVLAGIAMLVLPGQGLLTIAIGIMLMNFPGKYRLEQWLVSRGPILKAINWLRQRAGKPAMQVLPRDN